MLTFCGFISTFLGCNYTSLPLPHTQTSADIQMMTMHFEYEERTICYYYWKFLYHLYLVISAFHMFTNSIMWCIWLYFLWFTNQFYHIICTPTHFMSIRHWGSKAQTQKREDIFLHLDLWREDTDKDDYIMFPSEMNWIEEEASSSRAVVHPENCQK